MLRLFGVALLIALLGAAGVARANQTAIILNIDAWWTFDYAENSCSFAKERLGEDHELIKQVGCNVVNSCPELTARVDACVGGSRPQVIDFFDHLTANLASNTACSGVTVTVYEGPNQPLSAAKADIMSKPGFALLVDYLPGLAQQSWSLQAKGVFMKGEGEPEKIAAAVCKILTERGAKVLN